MPAANTAERITVMSCRSWPIVGCGRRLDDIAVVVVGNRVVAASSVAHHMGVVNGLRRREAQRRAPGVEVLAPDPAGEARSFEAVLRALEDVTPRVEIDRPGRCSFPTRGPSRYFGGDQAMSRRVAEVVAEALDGRTTVHVGTADSRFAAVRAAAMAEADGVRVVPPGASAAFLAPLPVSLLATDVTPGPLRTELDDLVDVLARLGLSTMGSFASLSVADVVARFGATGARAHGWASGRDHRPPAPEDPPVDLEVAMDLDPPIERVDQAAFVSRTLAEEFIAALRARGVGCARVAIIAETEHGEEQRRLWRSDEAFSATAISDRMRWQLDGWLSGPIRQRPTGGLSRLLLRPDDLSVAAGRQLGFWGEETGLAERAARAVARIQGLAGVGVAMVPELGGGRSPGDDVMAIPAESVDIVERAIAVDRTLFGGAVGSPADGASGEHAARPWPGGLPPPRPATVHDPPIAVDVVDREGRPVTVGARGLMEREPARLEVDGARSVEVVAWSGPWLLDERWWQPEQGRRSARMQIVLADGRAAVLGTRSGSWVVEASYD